MHVEHPSSDLNDSRHAIHASNFTLKISPAFDEIVTHYNYNCLVLPPGGFPWQLKKQSVRLGTAWTVNSLVEQMQRKQCYIHEMKAYRLSTRDHDERKAMKKRDKKEANIILNSLSEIS